jgi:hypothetical protein
MFECFELLPVALLAAATWVCHMCVHRNVWCAGTAKSHIRPPSITPAVTEPAATFAFLAVLVAAAAPAAAVAGLFLF